MLIRKTLQMLPAQLLSPLAQFASVLIWTHLASSETIGATTLVAGQQELVRTLFLGWWSQYALRYANEHAAQSARFSQTSDCVLALSALAQIALALCLLHWLVAASPSIALQVGTVAFVGLRGINQHNATVASALGRALDYNVLSLCGPVLGLAIGCSLLITMGDNPALPLLGYAVGEGAGLAYSWLGRSRGRPLGWIDQGILRQAVAYSAPLLISGVLAWLAANLSRYIIDHQLGLAAAGQFAVGFGLGQRAASLAAMLVTAAALPLAIQRAQQEGHEAGLQQLSDNCALLLATMLPALLGLHMVSPALVALFVAPAFVTSTLDILPWALLSGGCYAFIYNYLNHYFLITARTRPLILVDGALAVLTLSLSPPLIARFGLSGGVISMAVASLIVASVMLCFLLRRGLYFPVRHAFRIAFACVVMAVALGFMPLPEHPTSKLGVQILAGALAYGAAMAALYRRVLSDSLARLRGGRHARG